VFAEDDLADAAQVVRILDADDVVDLEVLGGD